MGEALSFLRPLVGVFGYPVAENPTEVMMEAASRDLGLDWRYLTVEVHPDHLQDAVRGARAMGWRGFNCTIPHKLAVIAYLDRLTPAAELIGAVNCVVIEDGLALGENTDGKGFLASFEGLRPARDANVVILGAGGAARAIAVELALAGARRLTIVNRTRSKAEQLAEHIAASTATEALAAGWDEPLKIASDVDAVIQATSIGLYPDTSCPAIDFETLRPSMIAADVIPNPPRTAFLAAAESRGCRTLDGLGMLVEQGVLGLRAWSGKDAKRAPMRDALEAVFRS